MDGDAPLAPGHPHLLAAVGALEVAVLAVLCPGAEGRPPALDGPDDLEKAGVFRPAAVQASGQGAEQADQQHHSAQQLKNQQTGEQKHDVKEKIQADKEQIQLVAPITPRHEADKPTADHGRSPPEKTGILGLLLY